MRRTLKSATLFTVGLVAIAAAHPHVFVDATITAIFDGKGLSGIKNHWVYDEMYSAATFASADSDGNGQLSAKETEQLKNGILGPIASSNYYNYVLVGTEFLPAKGVKNFKAEMKNGKLALDFTVSFSIPVKQDYTMATVAVNDPTNYIQMTTDMEEADVEAPDELDVDFFADNLKGLTLFRAFRSEIQGLYMRFKK